VDGVIGAKADAELDSDPSRSVVPEMVGRMLLLGVVVLRSNSTFDVVSLPVITGTAAGIDVAERCREQLLCPASIL